MLKVLGVEVTEVPKTTLALLMIPVMVLSLGWACNVQSTFTTIENILSQVAPAIQIVVSLLPLLGVKSIPPSFVNGVNGWAAQLNSDMTKLQAIVTQYQNDYTGTAQQQIDAVIQTTEQDCLSILQMVHVLDSATQAKITGLVTAIGSAIISVETIINNLNHKATLNAHISKGAMVVSGADFKTKFNTILHAPTGDLIVDGATARLNL